MSATQYLAIGRSISGATESQLFGKPCFKIEGKAFICYFAACMVFKLSGATHIAALALDGATLFDPSGKGRPMKAWVQVPASHQEQWTALARAACADVTAGQV